jgi:hypothetical protein
LAAPRGHPRYGGRQKGSRNRTLLERDEALARAYAAVAAGMPVENIADVTPLGAMLMCMQWAIQAKDRAGILAAASAAAPYMHPRLSSSEVRVTHALTTLSDEQLQAQALDYERKLAAANGETIDGEVVH